MANGCHSCQWCHPLGEQCKGSQWLCEKHDMLIRGNGNRCKRYKGKRYDRNAEQRIMRFELIHA